MKRIWLVLLFFFVWSFAEIKPVNPRELPRHMKSYKNYLIVLVHGMQADESAWDKYGFRDALVNLTGDPSFKKNIFAYSFDDRYAGYQANARQLGDRSNPANWLERARKEFLAKNPNLPAIQIPQKYIFISHSMGALAVRSYIYSDTLAASGVDSVNFPYGFYQNDVKKVIFIAPTHSGSSMADFVMHYMASDEGYKMGPSGWLKELINKLNLKGESFASSLEKARSYAEKQFNDYLQEVQKKSLSLLNKKETAASLQNNAINTEINLPKEKVKYFITEYAKTNYELDVVLQSTINQTLIIQTKDKIKIRRDILEASIKTELKNCLLQYGKTIIYGSEAKDSQSKNDWLKQQVENALVKAIEEFTDEIYQAAKQSEADMNAQIQEKTSFQNWQELVEYIAELNNKWILLSQNKQSEFNLQQWIDEQIKIHTGFNNWEELLAYVKTLKLGEEMEKYVADQLGKRQELDDIHTLYYTLVEQNNDPEQRAKLDELVSRYTRFKTYQELYDYLVTLKLEEKLEVERDLIIAQNTEFANWDQLCNFLKSISIEAEAKKALDKEVYLKTGFKTWEDLENYVKNFSMEVYIKVQADILIKQYTGFENLEELQNYIANLDLQKEWDKFFVPIKEKMETEGYFFNIALNIKDWPFDQQPTVTLRWHNWTELTPDLKQLEQDIVRMAEEYKFKVKVTDDIEFKTSIKQIKEKMAQLANMQNPMNRLFQIITEIDTAPLWTFPTVKVLIEANNYCASDQVKEFLDYAVTDVVLKKAIEGGAVPSLLSTNPATQVLKTAELPAVYEPIEYANVIPKGLVAFDRKETEAFNQFFYGDRPALQGAFKDLDKFMSSGIMPGVIANAYQIKLLTSAKYQRLPSGEARLAALLLSYSRGLFTKEGDGTIDIDSLRGKNVREISNADNHYVKFETTAVSDYVDHGFIEETIEAEATCQLIELAFNLCGGTTPPYVRGSVRLLPLFHFISLIVDNRESMLEDIMAHEVILKPERSLGEVEQSLYDTPLFILNNIYTVSGNEKNELSLTAFQDRTDDSQSLTSIPLIKENGLVYYPYAYNVKEPKIALQMMLYDFAPQLATIEYSYNFSAFKKITADNWGTITLPDFSVAEGQNILTLKVTNKVGRSNVQYLRIIRSSTPLIASELYPQPFSHTNKSSVPISVKFYNAQFITNNITASQLDEVQIDNQLIPLNSIQLRRGQDDEYRNYLQLIVYQSLAEGEHQVEIRAHDIYGHGSYTRWPFFVDTTPPEIKVEKLLPYSPSSNENIKVELEISDNFSAFLQELNLVIKNKSGNIIYHNPSSKDVACGPQQINFSGVDDYQNKLADGEYIVVITATDKAGNRGEQQTKLIIDSCSPVVSDGLFSSKVMSKKSNNLNYLINSDEQATVYLQLFNLEKAQKYSYILNDFVTKNNLYLYKHTFNFDQAEYFELPDGHYQAVASVVDLAGNITKTVTQDLLVDCTPPAINGLHAEPMILTNSENNPYSTKLEYQINDTYTPTSSGLLNPALKASIKVINKSSGLVVAQFSTPANLQETNSFIWKASDPAITRGAYTIILSAEDVYGNISLAYSEVIKDGIAPEITWPQSTKSIGGIVSIIGKVGDSDWTNVKSFDNYVLYWAAGAQNIPDNLNSIDKNIWFSAKLDVPYINRKPGQTISNISYRPAEQNTLLGYWDTSELVAGEYTILVIACEKDIGATAACVKTLQIDNAQVEKQISPYAFISNYLTEVNFTNTNNITLSILNTNKKANIGLEIIAPNNEVVKYHYATEVEGLSYYGQPVIDKEKAGVYLWLDDSGWHMCLQSEKLNSTSYKISIVGVNSVKEKPGNPEYDLKSGILSLQGSLPAGMNKVLDFELQPNISSIYIDSLLDNKTAEEIAVSGTDLYFGAGKFNMQYNPYVLNITGKEKDGFISINWDGKNQYGGYVDNGIYRLRLTAGGADGFGFALSETTINVKTPFVISKQGISPSDGSFNTFSTSLNSMSVKYLTNKDGFLNAQVFEANTNKLVCSLAENTKILGSCGEKLLTWNGAYPYPESTQRKITGNYYIKLNYQPADESPSQNLFFNNIQIFNNLNNSIQVKLNPLGSPTLFNDSQVQATAGSSEYSWSARGEGTYSVPKSFTYKISAEGEQEVSVNAFVPYAALYHRGFNKVKIKIIFEIWVEGTDKNGRKRPSQQFEKSYDAIFSPEQRIVNLNNYQSSTRFYNITSRNVSWIKICDSKGNTLFEVDPGLGKSKTVNLQGIFQFSYRLRDINDEGHQDIKADSLSLELLDGVKYSRLTNRYYAWYGYVNSDTEHSIDFSPWWQDLGKLGFVPTSFFSDPNFLDKHKEVMSGAMRVTINNQSVVYDKDIIKDPAAILTAIEKENVLYESIHCTDNSYYNYLDDEYCEVIPMALPVSINYLKHYVTKNIVDILTVKTNYSVKKNIPWPISEETVIASINGALAQAEKILKPKEIVVVDYNNLPVVINFNSVDFGGLGSSVQEISGFVSKYQGYQKKILDVFKFPNKHNLKLKISDISDPDIEVAFENGLAETALNSSDQKITAKYKTAAGKETIQPWSTEKDPFLKRGIIDSQQLVFNPDDFAPKTEYINIAEAYFDQLNRPDNIATQNIHPIDYYAFQENNYYDKNSGRITNPNLDINKWDIAVYDKTGALNKDLEISDLQKDNENLANNRFKVKLKLDTVEKRFVEICGEAAGPYELLYFDGSCWQTIATANTPASGQLAWWNVGRNNGKYTVALKVYNGSFGSEQYNISTQEVFIGELLKAGEDTLENKRVSSPYKRAEVYFHPNSYSEDKFITVTPVNLEDLDIENKPDIYTMGPITEILPHGSKFPEAENRPTLVYKYSIEDIEELKNRGVDIYNLSLYYLNETGEVEKANSELVSTNYGVEIRTALSHFSPYALLEGEVPPLPKLAAAYTMACNDQVKIYGMATPNTVLEVYVDDDNIFGDKDGIKVLSQMTATSNISAWIFDQRKWAEDYINKLSPAEREKIIAERQEQLVQLQNTIAQNNQRLAEAERQYQEVLAKENNNINQIRNFLDAQQLVTTATVRNIPLNQSDSAVFKKITSTSGVNRLNSAGLSWQSIAPELLACLPQDLLIQEMHQEQIQKGYKARKYFVQTDQTGHYEMQLPLFNNTVTSTVYVTYPLSEKIKNRPVASITVGQDPNAPKITALDTVQVTINKQNKYQPVTFNVRMSENGKIALRVFNQTNELILSSDLPALQNLNIPGQLDFSSFKDGFYHCQLMAVDNAGNTSFPLDLPVLVDTLDPSLNAAFVPLRYNPERTSLNILLKDQKEVADYKMKVFYQGVKIAELKKGNMYFEPIIINNDFANIDYNYELILIDQAGNIAIKKGSFQADTILPDCPQNFIISAEYPNAFQLNWRSINAEDLDSYVLAVKNLQGSITENIKTPSYYTDFITANNFYRFTLAAQDLAGNISKEKKQITAYLGKNKNVLLVKASQSAVVTYNSCTINIPSYAVSEDNLFVVQEAEEEYFSQTIGRKVISSIYRILASERTTFNENIKLEIKFDPELITKLDLRSKTIRICYWDGAEWQNADSLVTVNYQTGEVIAETLHFTEFAVVAEQEYRAYDTENSIIRFDILRNNDFLDTSVSISLTVQDAASPVNTNNMWILLDNIRYNLPSENFKVDPMSGGKSGKLEINIKSLIGTITEGNHTLQVFILDMAGNTANVQVVFTNKSVFEIKEVMNVPNPFAEEGTCFTYQLSKPAADIKIKIYTTNGRLIKEINNCANDCGFNKTHWDGRDDNNMFVANDVYIYAVIVERPDGEKEVIKGKAVAIR